MVYPTIVAYIDREIPYRHDIVGSLIPVKDKYTDLRGNFARLCPM